MSKLKREVISRKGPRMVTDQDVRRMLESRHALRRHRDRQAASGALMVIGLVVVAIVVAVWA